MGCLNLLGWDKPFYELRVLVKWIWKLILLWVGDRTSLLSLAEDLGRLGLYLWTGYSLLHGVANSVAILMQYLLILFDHIIYVYRLCEAIERGGKCYDYILEPQRSSKHGSRWA